MINTLIIEDEPKNAALLQKILQSYFPDLNVYKICESKKQAIEFLRKNTPGLIFMDIMLKDGSSFELFEELNIQNSQIIFLTAYDQFAIKAIKRCALDYLLKPIDLEELTKAVEKAKMFILKNEKHTQQLNVFHLNKEIVSKIVLPSIDGLSFLNISDICYMQSEGSYTTFYMNDDKKYVVSKQIKEYEDLLEDNGFFRVHQSFVINLMYIKKYIKGAGGSVIMENGKEIQVAIRRKEEFLKRINNR